jgi:glucose/arabinose dehydrogenase/N-acetylneuraminic acid mutarotase
MRPDLKNPHYHLRRSMGFVLMLLGFIGSLLILPASPSTALAGPAQQPRQGGYDIYISGKPERAQKLKLKQKKLTSKNIFVFVTPETGVRQVRFFIDHPPELLEDPLVAGTPYSVDTAAPFDLAGSEADHKARPFDTKQLADGEHWITAAIDLADGSTEVINTSFFVHNGKAKLLFDQSKVSFKLGRGGRGATTLRILPSDEKAAQFTLSGDAPWLTIESPQIGGPGRSGTGPAARTLTVNSAGLAPGSYSTTIRASGPGYDSSSLAVTLEVESTSTCAPLACSELKVSLPYALDFSADHQKIPDGAGIGTGFTYIDQPTTGTGYVPEKLTVNLNPPGTLSIATTAGIMSTSNNNQDNGIGVGVDAPSQISLFSTTLLDPPTGTGNFEQAGLWFGNDEDHYVKFIVMSTSTGTKIQYLMEVGGVQTKSKTTGALNLAGAQVKLNLRANPGDQIIRAYYNLNGGASVVVGEFIAPPEFFSFDAAGIDPTIGTRSFGGIFGTHRNGPNPVTYTFDDFSVVNGGNAGSDPSAGADVAFDRVTFGVPNPTALTMGPDGRLYVTELFGKIHKITLGDAKQVISDQVITTLGSRLTLGITIDPASTPDNVIVWVSHSNASTSNGELNSSIVSRLTGPNLTTREDVITGLPRAIANHAINSLEFGPDGKLYIAHGGNTGAGAPNTANTEFGTRAEQPLSAALLVADVKAAGFDGTCATPENTYAPSPCSVVPYATGLRNAYDLVWHSNGLLYAPDNGLGVTGTYPPAAAPPCEGFGNTALWTQGGHNPGEQPDILLLVEQGKYYGHPNPYRNECVFKDGSYQGVQPLANYEPALYNLGMNRSADGIIEYRSDVFGGALKGELLITNYSVGDNITRVRLSSDGRSVIEAKQLAGGFNNPLPITEGPDGTIYVGELGASRVTALVPKPSGSWVTKASLPAALLDVGGAALGGKFYVVAGKTTAGPQRTMYIYDPAADSWSSGPSLPAEYPAVENPAVAALNGKLYVFGGSTSPFSGATASAAVFDPGAGGWTMLPAMGTARGGPTAQAINGKLYVAGGMDGSGASVSVLEIFDPATNGWSSGAAMGTRRDNPGSAAIGGKLYIFGGRTRNADGSTPNGTLNTAEVYDPATGAWAPITSMPTGRRTFAVGVVNGRALAMGGEQTSSGGTFPQNEEYDPATGSWRALALMLSPRHGAAAATIDNIVYVAGGGTTGGSSFSTIHEAFSYNVVDTTAPTVSSVSPADGASPVPVGTNVSATLSEGIDPASLNSSTFTLVKQGTTAAVSALITYDATSRTATLNPNSDLELNITYIATVKGGASGAKDLAGNPLAADKLWSFTTGTVADTTPPETTITGGPSGTVTTSSASFTFSSSEAGSTFECSLDGAAFATCTSPQNYSGLADGAHTFMVRAIDAAGNVDASSATRTWTIDTSSVTGYTLLYSLSSDRSNPVPLEGAMVSGNIYVFLGPESGVLRVRFYLDNPAMSGRPRQTETNPPYDFAGGSVATATAWKTSTVANGTHVITAAVDLSAGGTQVMHANFTVSN